MYKLNIYLELHIVIYGIGWWSLYPSLYGYRSIYYVNTHMCIYSGLGIVPRADLNTYCPYMNDISDILGGKMLGILCTCIYISMTTIQPEILYTHNVSIIISDST